MTDEGMRRLAAGVCLQAVKDINSNDKNIVRKAICDIKMGGLDIWLNICGIKISRDEFIERAKNNAKNVTN